MAGEDEEDQQGHSAAKTGRHPPTVRTYDYFFPRVFSSSVIPFWLAEGGMCMCWGKY